MPRTPGLLLHMLGKRRSVNRCQMTFAAIYCHAGDLIRKQRISMVTCFACLIYKLYNNLLGLGPIYNDKKTEKHKPSFQFHHVELSHYESVKINYVELCC